MFNTRDLRVIKFKPADDGSYEVFFQVGNGGDLFKEVLTHKQIYEEFGFDDEDHLLTFMKQLGGQYVH